MTRDNRTGRLSVCLCAKQARERREAGRSGTVLLASRLSPNEKGEESGFPPDMSGPIQDGQSMGT